METTKSSKKIWIGIIAIAAVIAVLLIAYSFMKPTTATSQKTITIEVVHKDKTSKEFTYETSQKFLGDALKDEKLVEGEEGAYGLFITSVDGEAADDSNQEWWCLTKDGGPVNTSADQTPIADGEHYELTLTVGY